MPRKTSIAIKSQSEYDGAMARVLALMKIGEKKLTAPQLAELRTLSEAAGAYEKTKYTIPAPTTLEGLIELKMYERRLKQKDLAELFGMSVSKVSEILNNKRPADVAFLKAAHEQLGIDGNLLLTFA